MSWGDRIRRRWTKNLKDPSSKGASEDGKNDDEDGQKVQYRLESTEKQQNRSFLSQVVSCFGVCGRSTRGSSLTVGINPNQRLAMYLHWMFRVNFIFLFAVMCTMFFALVIFFAGIIAAVGNIDKECVRIGDEKFDSADTAFADAFALSWTVCT